MASRCSDSRDLALLRTVYYEKPVGGEAGSDVCYSRELPPSTTKIGRC